MKDARPPLTHAQLVARMRPRPDAAERLAGAPYLTDRQHPEQLFGAILGSSHAHARILSLDLSVARALPGVHCVIGAADVPGRKAFGLRHVDRPVFCAERVRCIGDPVAAVAAETPEQARAALAAIRVEYQPLPLVDDPEAALAPGAIALHGDSNLLHRETHRHGDLAAAIAASRHIVEGEFLTPRQMPTYLETEGGIAEPDGQGGLTLYFGAQNPIGQQQMLAAILALPEARVRVVNGPLGGSYGGKDELTIQPIAALLALHSGRPVRLRLSREESVDLGVKRHPMRIRMKSGCDAEGRLLFRQVEILADTGAYATHGPEILDAAVEHASGPYRYQALSIDARLAYTNNGIAGAFRGFGAVQVQFALERQMDELAALAGLAPDAFRARNLCGPNDPGPLGQVVAPFDGPRLALDEIRRHPLWQGPRRWQDGRWLHGVGMALIHRSDGFGKDGPNGAGLEVALAADGCIEVRTSFTEMGQNLLDVIRVLGARHLGCDEARIRPLIGDSAIGVDSGPSAASRCTTVLNQLLQRLAPAWRARLKALAGDDSLEPGPEGLLDRQGQVHLSYAELAATLDAGELPIEHFAFAGEVTPSDNPIAHFVFGACAAIAHVRVDCWTGQVQVLHVTNASALGPVVSPLGYLGQIEGGLLMGQGMATLEDLPMREGRYLTRNLDGYFIPTLLDAPQIEVIAIEDILDGDEIGPRGAGEIGVNIGAPAVANAIAEALQMPVRQLPVSAERVLDHLERQP